ncbi:hypothetical protein BH24CHL1_BH24CHL1_16370 [soil metagenome]
MVILRNEGSCWSAGWCDQRSFVPQDDQGRALFSPVRRMNWDRRAQRRSYARPLFSTLVTDTGLLVVTAASLLASALFITFAILRHRTYHSAAMDFAFFDQIVWNTSQGRWFETSFVPYNFMGQHVEPVLLLFAGLYWLTPAPEWMLIVQALAACGAAIVLYLLARERIERAWLAALIAMSYLLSPTLHDALAFDYHSEVMAPLFVFGGMLLLLRGRTVWGVALLLGMLLLKEDAALVLIGLALPLWLLRERRAAMTVAVVGVAWVVLVVGLLMPAVRGGESDLEARYSHLGEGTGAGGIARGLVVNPVGATGHVLSRWPAHGLFRQLVPQGGISMLAPLWLLSAAPVALLQFLSSHDTQQQLRLQYGAQVLPLVMLATVEGFRWLERASGDHANRSLPILARMESRTQLTAPLRKAVFVFVVCTLASAAWYSPVHRLAETRVTATDPATAQAAFARIPAEASVSAQSGLAPHLSQREQIWEFPVLNDAEYVILDTHGPVSRPYWAIHDAEVAALPERGYDLVWSEGSLRIYERNAP